MSADESRYERIYAVVRAIPYGRVANYGQIAELAGLGGHARQVGYALHALRDERGVPWHRVVNARGEISARAEPGDDSLQRERLEREGVRFDAAGRLDLERYRWRPKPSDPAREASGSRCRAARDASSPRSSRSGIERGSTSGGPVSRVGLTGRPCRNPSTT